MSAFLASAAGKFLLGLLMPILVGIVREYARQGWDKIPEWAKPLITALLGALSAGSVAAVSGSTDPNAIVAAAAVGASGGAIGKAVRDGYRVVRPEPDAMNPGAASERAGQKEDN